jgi:hypothetical protein
LIQSIWICVHVSAQRESIFTSFHICKTGAAELMGRNRVMNPCPKDEKERLDKDGKTVASSQGSGPLTHPDQRVLFLVRLLLWRFMQF